MKLFLTDKFLWKIYNFLGLIEENIDSLILTKRKLAFPHLYKLQRMYKKEKRRRKFTQFINYLKKQGYIEIENLKGKQALLLTEKGFKKVLKTKFKIKKKKRRKDKKWIMLIFDIPEEKKHLRERLRRFLFPLGFQVLQRSVWVCPYDVLEDVKRVLRLESIDPYVQIFLVEEIKK